MTLNLMKISAKTHNSVLRKSRVKVATEFAVATLAKTGPFMPSTKNIRYDMLFGKFFFF